MRDLFNFDSKKDRDDFFIALVVIAFFGFLFSLLYKKDTPLEDAQALPKVAAIAPIQDSDEDGVTDELDACPTIKGTADNKGCPKDSDGDGVYDIDDKCPTEAGISAHNGCPIDSDGDGVFDLKDACPELAGTLENGCPPDKDGDGIYDADDKCPTQKGTIENKGCPAIEVEKHEKEILKTAMRAVEFEYNSSNLKPRSKGILNRIVTIMEKYPKYKLAIHGHTDDAGTVEYNRTLSIERAKSCYDYLIEQGVAAYRLSYRGYGETQPIKVGTTEQARKRNRRVEFKLHW